jgi:hypothetical protein
MGQTRNLYIEFTDGGDIIRLEPVCLTYPTATVDYDRNWIKTNVTVKGGAFGGHFIGDFLTTEFELLKRKIRVLANDFNAAVLFQATQGQLAMKITGDGLGHFELDFEASPEPHLGQTLSFSINFDQTEIDGYLRQLNKITTAFPISGDFNIRNE